MKVKKIKLQIILGIIALTLSPIVKAGWPGDWINKIADISADILTAGEHGQDRDRERANYEAEIRRLLAEGAQKQVAQQVEFLKKQIGLGFDFYCDDVSNLKKIQEVQYSNIQTIAAFKGALLKTISIKNNLQAYSKIQANLQDKLSTVKTQLSNLLNNKNNESFLTIHQITKEIHRIAESSGQNTELVLSYIMSKLYGDSDSTIATLNTMISLLSMTQQLITNLELDLQSQVEKSIRLNEAPLAQISILASNLNPRLIDGSGHFLSLGRHQPTPGKLCDFSFLDANTSSPYSLEYSIYGFGYVMDIIHSTKLSLEKSSFNINSDLSVLTAQLATEQASKFSLGKQFEILKSASQAAVVGGLNKPETFVNSLTLHTTRTFEEFYFDNKEKEVQAQRPDMSPKDSEQTALVLLKLRLRERLGVQSGWLNFLTALGKSLAQSLAAGSSLDSDEALVDAVVNYLNFAKSNKLSTSDALYFLILQGVGNDETRALSLLSQLYRDSQNFETGYKILGQVTGSSGQVYDLGRINLEARFPALKKAALPR